MDKKEKINVFSEDEFIRSFLILLHKYGVHKIRVHELSKKLFYFYNNSLYKDLFCDVARIQNAEEMNIYDAVEREKILGAGVCWSSNCPKKIILAYDPRVTISEKLLNTREYELLDKMAQEFALRYNFEQASNYDMNIYVTSPNRNYIILSGKHYDNKIKWELITDGNVDSIDDNYEKRIYYCDDPLNTSQKILLINQINLSLHLSEASYAVMQGKLDGHLVASKVYSETTDLYLLNKISEVANTTYKFNQTVPILDRPYVKRLIIK